MAIFLVRMIVLLTSLELSREMDWSNEVNKKRTSVVNTEVFRGAEKICRQIVSNLVRSCCCCCCVFAVYFVQFVLCFVVMYFVVFCCIVLWCVLFCVAVFCCVVLLWCVLRCVVFLFIMQCFLVVCFVVHVCVYIFVLLCFVCCAVLCFSLFSFFLTSVVYSQRNNVHMYNNTRENFTRGFLV